MFGDEISTEQEFELTIAKLGGAGLIFTINLIVGLIPLKVKSCRENVVITGIANSFAAGVFIALGIGQLLPEAQEIFEHYAEEQAEKTGKEPDEFPYPFFIAVAAFSFILFVEKVAFDPHSMMHGHDADTHGHGGGSEEHGHGHGEEHGGHGGHDNVKKSILVLTGQYQDDNDKLLMDGVDNAGLEDEDEEHGHGGGHGHGGEHGGHGDEHGGHGGGHGHGGHDHQDEKEQAMKYLLGGQMGAKMSVLVQSVAHAGHGHGDKNDLNEKPIQAQSLLAPYLLLFALSVHSVFEGLATGFQLTVQETIQLLFATIIHKWAEALALGISFGQGGATGCHAYVMIGIFAASNPIGIVIGWVFSNGDKLLSAIFMGIGAGTFVYVSASEIVVEEFSVSRNKWLKFFFMLVGITLIGVLQIFHTHEGH